jgi:hypothetical protein
VKYRKEIPIVEVPICNALFYFIVYLSSNRYTTHFTGTIMKNVTSALILAASLASFGATAFAAAPMFPKHQNSTSSLTRAEVLAELQQAKATGQVTFGENDVPANVASSSTVTRAQVEAEAASARAHHKDTLAAQGYPNTGA